MFDDKSMAAIEAYNKKFVELQAKAAKWNNVKKKSTIAQAAYNATMKEASEEVRKYVSENNTGVISIDKLTKSSRAAELGMKGLTAVGNVALTALASFAASKAIEGISYAMNYSKTLADSAKGAGEAITQTNEDIDSYKDKITELQGVLSDHSSTVEEVTNAKQQLLDIQNELTEKYGSEASGIDLVNGSLERQLEITSTALTMPLFTDLLTSYTKQTNR